MIFLALFFCRLAALQVCAWGHMVQHLLSLIITNKGCSVLCNSYPNVNATESTLFWIKFHCKPDQDHDFLYNFFAALHLSANMSRYQKSKRRLPDLLAHWCRTHCPPQYQSCQSPLLNEWRKCRNTPLSGMSPHCIAPEHRLHPNPWERDTLAVLAIVALSFSLPCLGHMLKQALSHENCKCRTRC